MALYQRRLASSTRAMRRSLENRANRLEKALKEAQDLARIAPPDLPDWADLEEMEEGDRERLERMLDAVTLAGDADLEERLLKDVDEARFRSICENALEGLASKKLNLKMLVERRARARELGPEPEPGTEREPVAQPEPEHRVRGTTPAPTTLRVHGDVPPEMWNRLGTKLVPKLLSGKDLRVGLTCELTVDGIAAKALAGELRQILADLGIAERIHIEGD